MAFDALDVISLRGLTAVGRHGVYDFERQDGQVFSADLELHIDSRRAAQTDEVANTVDYSEIAEKAVAILSGEPVALIETVAANLAEMVLENPLVQKVRVTVHKPTAPLPHQFEDVSVSVTRTRIESVPDVPAIEGAGLLVERARVVDLARQEQAQEPAPVLASGDGPVGLVLSLGSNQGESLQILRGAVEALRGTPGLRISKVSPAVSTRPVLQPGAAPQRDYWNIVVLGETSLEPERVLQETQRIEAQFGRARGERWASRTLDIDIIDLQGLTVRTSTLVLPHPRAFERAFVLYPWSLLQPDAVLTDAGPIADLVKVAPDRRGILNTRRDWMANPQSSGQSLSPAGDADSASGAQQTPPSRAWSRERSLEQMRAPRGSGDPQWRLAQSEPTVSASATQNGTARPAARAAQRTTQETARKAQLDSARAVSKARPARTEQSWSAPNASEMRRPDVRPSAAAPAQRPAEPGPQSGSHTPVSIPKLAATPGLSPDLLERFNAQAQQLAQSEPQPASSEARAQRVERGQDQGRAASGAQRVAPVVAPAPVARPRTSPSPAAGHDTQGATRIPTTPTERPAQSAQRTNPRGAQPVAAPVRQSAWRGSSLSENPEPTPLPDWRSAAAPQAPRVVEFEPLAPAPNELAAAADVPTTTGSIAIGGRRTTVRPTPAGPVRVAGAGR